MLAKQKNDMATYSNSQLEKVSTALPSDFNMMKIVDQYSRLELLHYVLEHQHLDQVSLVVKYPSLISTKTVFGFQECSTITKQFGQASESQLSFLAEYIEFSDQAYQLAQSGEDRHETLSRPITRNQDCSIINVSCELEGAQVASLQKNRRLIERLIEFFVGEHQPVNRVEIDFYVKPSLQATNVLIEKPVLKTAMLINLDLSLEHPAIARAISYISDHYQEDISMRDLSQASYVSSSHLSSLLKQRFGLSFKKILMNIRIEQAKYVLSQYPQRQITMVCNDAGFSDLSHFEKTFKKIVGMCPSVYRSSVAKCRKSDFIDGFFNSEIKPISPEI